MTEPSGVTARPSTVSVGEIFRVFLLLGATSFGGGVVAYLRSSLVGRHRWLDDTSFIELLSISQTLPGLNATNMAVLVGDRLRGTGGAIAAICGICLPGAVVMFVVGLLYGQHGGRPVVSAMLHGVAAAAVGLVSAVSLQIGRRSLGRLADVGFVALSILGVHALHLPVPAVLVGVGALAIWWHRPRIP